MNLLVRPHQPPEDDLDGLLRAFFRAEMPHPWPDPKALPAPPAAAPARPSPTIRALWRSRLALAASVALLVAGSLLLAGRAFHEPPAAATPSGVQPTAGGKGVDPWDPVGKRAPRRRESMIVGPDGTSYRMDFPEAIPEK